MLHSPPPLTPSTPPTHTFKHLLHLLHPPSLPPPPSTLPPSQVGTEEFWDYMFPEEAGSAPHLKLLELAYRHKRQKTAAEEEGADA